jgi:hypothetical protein
MKQYQFVSVPGAYQFAKQESIVFAALRELGRATIEQLAAKCMELGLQTRQDPERIVGYYLVSLRKLGLVRSDGGATRKVTVVVEEVAA